MHPIPAAIIARGVSVAGGAAGCGGLLIVNLLFGCSGIASGSLDASVSSGIADFSPLSSRLASKYHTASHLLQY